MMSNPDYGLVWMSPNQMMLQDSNNLQQQPTPDMMSMDTGQNQLDSPYYLSTPMHQLDGFLMMEDFDGDYCGEPPKFMTSATQTQSRRKIRPVNHPGLKLQSPITYKSGSDPNAIPIQKDGMGVCQKCGAMGVKHAFYTRHRKFCSLACARGSMSASEGKEYDEELSQSQDSSDSPHYKFPNGTEIEDTELLTKQILPLDTGICDSLPSYNVAPGIGVFPFSGLILPEDPSPPTQTPKAKQPASFDWCSKLNKPDFQAAPVDYFKHAPMSDSWDDIQVGMKVEVENTEYESSFWVATVNKVFGYKALLRYEGYADPDQDFWVNLCFSSVHPVGWCATRGKPLIPPSSIASIYKDFKDFLVRRLTGAQTLPTNFYSKVQESLKSRFRVGHNVEVIDKSRIRQVRVATVRHIVGKRLHVEYWDAEDDDPGFWCHEDSSLLHPVGWASRVGHEISAPFEYLERCENGLIDKDDATDELFTAPFQSATNNRPTNQFVESMKIEAIDPLNLSTICAATIMKVLNDGYLMIRIDKFSSEIDKDLWFCYHSNSSYIFPPGFCHSNNIPLMPPTNYEPETFSWEQYVKASKCVLAPAHLFSQEIPEHGFEPGMQLESADIMDPRLVCVATISRVVGRLLRVHFDGWEDEYDQWLDCRSPDLYPVGWCDLVQHKLEAPQSPLKPNAKKPARKKRVRGKLKAPPPRRQLNAESTELNLVIAHSPVPGAEQGSVPLESPAYSEDSVASSNTAVQPSTPVPSTPASEQKSTFIPRLIDGGGPCVGDLEPAKWTCEDVATFLKTNDCGVYADQFICEAVDGPKLLQLTQDQTMVLTGSKIGPTLKILNLISQLKVKTSKASFKKTL